MSAGTLLKFRTLFPAICLFALSSVLHSAEPPRRVSGIDPKLAVFNDENECGIGAVVPWADRLWVITYAPHKPGGSTDKLYEITPEFQQIVRPESVGGTPANRMIHTESQQLFIGPYVIDRTRNVRVIPPSKMFGRLTANARHLFDPANKIYFATMEEGIYEVDVKSLDVNELWTDEHKKTGHHAQLPGYHGKGMYSGQRQLVYANNGERGNDALTKPETASGVLASWDGEAPGWTVIRRNQFTEVTGPGGIFGSSNPEKDPIWSIGWDHRSLILNVLFNGEWHTVRLPKGSHSYDGAHGWNTEWPRIRDIGEDDLLMTMHGTFWRFPRHFNPVYGSGIRPRSNYLKVVGDFCRWGDHVVLGCDDAAHSEFLNKRKLKGSTITAGQSQSNLQFRTPESLDHIGPVIGRGGLWIKENVTANQISDPYLFAGYHYRTLHLSHESDEPLTIKILASHRGTKEWVELQEVTLPPHGHKWIGFPKEEPGEWIRLIPKSDGKKVTAFFQYSNQDQRTTTPDAIFTGLARPDDQQVTGGLLHVRGANFRTLRFVARTPVKTLGGYDLDADLKLKRIDDPKGVSYVEEKLAIPQDVIEIDSASVLYIDDAGRRWRLPKGVKELDAAGPLGPERVCREVCTERDLLNVAGTFYELPAENAGGFARLRPVATHNHRISDFTSYRGMLVISGVRDDAANPDHIIVSEDGQCRLWVGSVDDLWAFGKPRGVGGPWFNSAVQAGQPSDPYLMTGYDRKRVDLSHTSVRPITINIEVDFTGLGDWTAWKSVQVPPGQTVEEVFPAGFQAYWVRVVADQDTTASATFHYE